MLQAECLMELAEFSEASSAYAAESSSEGRKTPFSDVGTGLLVVLRSTNLGFVGTEIEYMFRKQTLGRKVLRK